MSRSLPVALAQDIQALKPPPSKTSSRTDRAAAAAEPFDRHLNDTDAKNRRRVDDREQRDVRRAERHEPRTDTPERKRERPHTAENPHKERASDRAARADRPERPDQPRTEPGEAGRPQAARGPDNHERGDGKPTGGGSEADLAGDMTAKPAPADGAEPEKAPTTADPVGDILAALATEAVAPVITAAVDADADGDGTQAKAKTKVTAAPGPTPLTEAGSATDKPDLPARPGPEIKVTPGATAQQAERARAPEPGPRTAAATSGPQITPAVSAEAAAAARSADPLPGIPADATTRTPAGGDSANSQGASTATPQDANAAPDRANTVALNNQATPATPAAEPVAATPALSPTAAGDIATPATTATETSAPATTALSSAEPAPTPATGQPADPRPAGVPATTAGAEAGGAARAADPAVPPADDTAEGQSSRADQPVAPAKSDATQDGNGARVAREQSVAFDGQRPPAPQPAPQAAKPRSAAAQAPEIAADAPSDDAPDPGEIKPRPFAAAPDRPRPDVTGLRRAAQSQTMADTRRTTPAPALPRLDSLFQTAETGRPADVQPTTPSLSEMQSMAMPARAAVANGSAPAFVANGAATAGAVAVQIAHHVRAGSNRFEIRLDPPELGRVDVRLEIASDGKVQAHLSFERADALDTLQRDAKTLERALADAGLEPGEDGLTFSLKDNGADESGQDSSEDGPAATPEDVDDADTVQNARVYAGHIRADGVDIRV